MPELLTIKYRDRSGAWAQVRCLKQGRGRPLLLIHGVGMRAEVWEPQLEVLSSMYEVLAIDMLGHGFSSRPPHDAILDDYVAAAIAVLEHCAAGPTHVIGHSMGALVALELALQHPKRVASLVALNAVFCRTPEQRSAIWERVEALQDPGTVVDWEPTIRRWFGHSVDASEAPAERTRSLLRMNDPVGYERTYRLFALSDAAHRDRMGALEVPALFLTGELDPNSSGEMSAAMAMLAPHGRCEIIPGERHMMAIASPEAVNSRLAAFLTSVDGASPCAAFDPNRLRAALGSFVTGVTVVSAIDGNGSPRGFTANSFTSVSLDPPLVLVCIAKTASSCPVFSTAGHFTVSVLSDSQIAVSNLFATKAADKFAQTAWRPGTHGSPVIENAAASFECRRYELHEAGDHVLLIGEVLAFEHSLSTPLAYCRGAYVDLHFDVDLICHGRGRLRVGALIEQDGALLLEKRGKRGYDLPWAARLGDASDRSSLRGRLGAEGFEAAVDFVFAVFEDHEAGDGVESVVYRGVLKRAAATDAFVILPFDQIPWDKIPDKAVAAMLRRYIDERRANLFGVYTGDADQGIVQRLARSA